MKRIFVMFLVLILALFCSGCSKPADDQKNQSADVSPASDNAAAYSVTPEPQVYYSGDYQYIILDKDTIEITKYTGSEQNVSIPYILDGMFVTSIGKMAFLRSEMTRVSIPSGVKTIKENAFCECESLKSISIPNTVTTIEGEAFSYCDSLTSFTIPDTVTNITGNPFTHCKNLTEITVSAEHPTLAIIDGVLFCKTDKRLVCYPYTLKAKDYKIPNGIQSIGDYAFYYAQFNTISIPESVTSIGDSAFYNTSLVSITLPDSITNIGNGAFRFSNVSSITIPNSVTNMGFNPFADCGDISIIISANHPALSLIDGVLFSKSDKRLIYYPSSSTAESYTTPDGIEIIDDWAFVGSNLKTIHLPDSIKRIGNSAFCRCRSLSEINIPNSVTQIGESTFSLCGALTDITIPDSVTYIGKYAFSGCDSLILSVARDSYIAKYCVENNVNHSYPDELDWLNN